MGHMLYTCLFSGVVCDYCRQSTLLVPGGLCYHAGDQRQSVLEAGQYVTGHARRHHPGPTCQHGHSLGYD